MKRETKTKKTLEMYHKQRKVAEVSECS